MIIVRLLIITLVGASMAYDPHTIDKLIKDRLDGRDPEYYQANLEEEERLFIVDQHNEDRTTVDPPAANMMKIHYDMRLEELAIKWAERCNFEHPDRDQFPEYKGIGQNLGLTRGMKRDWKPVIKMWNDERNYYDYESHTCENGKACGHYTQVVNGKTTGIGCAVKLCDGHHGWGSHTLLWVCQYIPPGNYRGVRPYEQGEWCSKCPSGFHCEGGKLCSNGSNVQPVKTTTTSTTTTSTTTTTTPTTTTPTTTTTTTSSVSIPKAHKLTPAERQMMLDVHNAYRKLVDATNMRRLLEELAVKWLSKCSGKEFDVPGYENYGSNQAQSVVFELDLEALASTWFAAGPAYDNWNLTCRVPDCRPYKQAMYCYVSYIGCAWNRCNNLKPSTLAPVYDLLCIYDMKPYDWARAWLPGPRCSKCPSGYKCDKEELCAAT